MQIRIFYDPADPRQLRSDNSPVVVSFLVFVIFSFLISCLWMIKMCRRELNGKPQGYSTAEEILAGFDELQRKLGEFDKTIRLLPKILVGIVVVSVVVLLLRFLF